MKTIFRKQAMNTARHLAKVVHLTAAGTLLLSVYLTGAISSIRAGELFYFLIPTSWRAFDIGLFFLLLILSEVGGLIGMIRGWRKSLRLDKTGKRREFNTDYQPQGDAHWAEPAEYHSYAQLRNVKKTRGVVLGQLSMDGSECIDFTDPGRINENILVIGGSGAGKTFTFVRPYILQSIRQGRSMIITDPKGELYQHHAAYLHQQGYIVRRFDLITPDLSDGWDPFAFLRAVDEDHLGETVDVFASTVIENMGDVKGGDGVYNRASIALLKAVIFYTLKKDKENATFAKLMEYLTHGLEKLDEAIGEDSSGKVLYEEAHYAYMSFRSASPNLAGNILVHVATGLNKIQAKKIMKIMTTDHIDMSLPGKQKCAYFCRFSATDATYRFITALFFSMQMDTLIRQADRSNEKRLKVKTLFLMDEFPSLGVFPGWNEKLALMRSYGIAAVMITQSLPQLILNYGEMTLTAFISNCGCIVNIGCNDSVTAQMLQTRMGKTTVQSYTFNENIQARSHSYGSGTLGTDLMSIKDIQEMPEDDSIVIFQHRPPIYCHKTPVTLWPEYALLTEVQDEEILSIGEEEKKQKFFKEEAEYAEKVYLRTEEKTFDQIEENDEVIPISYAGMTIFQLLLSVMKEDFFRIRIEISHLLSDSHSEPQKKIREEKKISLVLSSEEVRGLLDEINLTGEDEKTEGYEAKKSTESGKMDEESGKEMEDEVKEQVQGAPHSEPMIEPKKEHKTESESSMDKRKTSEKKKTVRDLPLEEDLSVSETKEEKKIETNSEMQEQESGSENIPSGKVYRNSNRKKSKKTNVNIDDDLIL